MTERLFKEDSIYTHILSEKNYIFHGKFKTDNSDEIFYIFKDTTTGDFRSWNLNECEKIFTLVN